MKDNKFCISRTLVYLVLLIVAVVGGLYVTGKMNSQNLSSKPKAAGDDSCPRYDGGGYNAENRVIAYIEYSNDSNYLNPIKCYGFTGLRTKYSDKNEARKNNPGKMIYYADEIAEKVGQSMSKEAYNGCFMEEIPCFIPKQIVKDEETCDPNTYTWAPNPTPTGKTYGTGSKSFYGFQQICVKNTGYKIVGFKAVNDGSHFYYFSDPSDTISSKCQTTTKGVNEWNCQSITSAPKLMGKYYGGYDESLCPKGTLIWLSYANNVNNDNTKKQYDYNWEDLKTNPISPDPQWDLCVKLTGYWEAKKDSKTGLPFYRCRYVTFSNAQSDKCGGNYYYDDVNKQIIQKQQQ